MIDYIGKIEIWKNETGYKANPVIDDHTSLSSETKIYDLLEGNGETIKEALTDLMEQIEELPI